MIPLRFLRPFSTFASYFYHSLHFPSSEPIYLESLGLEPMGAWRGVSTGFDGFHSLRKKEVFKKSSSKGL